MNPRAETYKMLYEMLPMRMANKPEWTSDDFEALWQIESRWPLRELIAFGVVQGKMLENDPQIYMDVPNFFYAVLAYSVWSYIHDETDVFGRRREGFGGMIQRECGALWNNEGTEYFFSDHRVQLAVGRMSTFMDEWEMAQTLPLE